MLLVLNAENPSKAIAYVRVSSQRQVDEGVSIDAQVKRLREYARYKGMDIDDKDIINSFLCYMNARLFQNNND
jgi:DNA invertase Pin-like site-specific DNA recombinase